MLAGVALFVIFAPRLNYTLGQKNSSSTPRRPSRKVRVTVVAILAVSGLATLLLSGVGLPASISVDTGGVQLSASPYVSATVSSAEIQYAYVGVLGTGNLTLSLRQFGVSNGGFNAGVFSLSNGRTADVLSSGSQVLVVSLKDGDFLILGPSDFQHFITVFGSEVFPVRQAS